MAVQRVTPYSEFNFRVEIDGIEDAGFSEVSCAGFSIDVTEYRNGSDKENAIRKLPGLTRYDNVTLKRGIVGSLTFSN